jgi:hypothetical protein
MLDRHDITRLYDRHAPAMLGFFVRRTLIYLQRAVTDDVPAS